MSNIKTYTRVGTAVPINDAKQTGTQLRVANNANREYSMVDHTNIKFIDLPYPMDKYHAAQYAQTMPPGVWTAEQKAALKAGADKAFEKYYS